MAYDYLAAVREFHVKFNHHISDEIKPLYPIDLVELRDRLIKEEVWELREVLDNLSLSGGFSSRNSTNLINLSKELADVLYVIFGAALAFGIPIEEIFREVHRSNMTKGIAKDNGKTLKGPDYEAPQLETIFEAFLK